MNLVDKVAVVTGGASGLGRATLEELIKVGVKVAAFDLNKDQGEQFVAEFGADKVLFSWYRCYQ